VSKLFTTRRRIAIVVGASAMVLAGGGAAFAYFTASGSGTGSATVGSTGTWLVAESNTSGGPIYPGSGTETITFSVKNTGTGDQQFLSAVASVNSDSNGNVTTGSGNNVSSVTGCKATWFSLGQPSGSPIGTNVAGGATVSVQVTVTMPTDSTDNQNACESATPNVTLTVS
jgi:archaellum component FlaG (FlaF/FlaG flagellin family)